MSVFRGMKRTRIGDIGQVVSGSTPKTDVNEYWDKGNIVWLTPTDLRTEEKYLSEGGRKITEAGLKSANLTLVPKGTVLLTSRAPIGKVAIAGTELCTNQGFKNIICFDKIHNEYLYYYLKGSTEFLNHLGRGATFKEISKTIVEDIEIPLPPLETQEKIADTLDKAQELIDKRQRQIDLLDEFLQSVFLDMFGDPVSNSEGWQVRKLSELGQLSRGKSQHRPRNDPILLGGPYPLIQTGDVAKAGLYIKDFSQTYSERGLAQSKLWPSGTLCITIAANIAKTGILTFDACFPDSVVAFSPNEKANINFIQFWFIFLQEIIEANAPESAQKNINLRILENLDVICPSKELQDKFAVAVQDVEQKKNGMKVGLIELQNLFNSIMQRAFKGELFN